MGLGDEHAHADHAHADHAHTVAIYQTVSLCACSRLFATFLEAYCSEVHFHLN